MDTERALVPAVASALAAACSSLAEGSAADAVGGVGGVGGIVPSYVASPASTAEASALLRAAASAGLAVVPRGAGTGLSWGGPPSRCDLVLDLRAMDQIIEHAAGDLVARVQAGVTIGQLAAALAAAGQQLALDAPEDATVGGVVASGLAGPRRFRYGTPRDLLIGLTVVRADGVIAHSGGKVVKNVAGYDIGKLFCGSQGTLGLITEATFRLHPLPAAVAWVTAEWGPAERAGAVAAVAAAAGSPLVPSAVELDWPASSRALRVGVLLEGSASGVAERAEQMSGLLEAVGGSADVAQTAPARWGLLPLPSTVIRVSFWVSALESVLEALGSAAASAGGSGAPGVSGVSGVSGVRLAVTGPAGAGALYACLAPHDPATQDEAAVRFVTGLRERLSGAGGSAGPRGGVAVLAASPAVLAATRDRTVPGLALMRAVKDQFDPDHRMFPGRFGGGAPVHEEN